LISRRPSAILAGLVHRPLVLAALSALALAAAGCSTPCEELGKRVCACQPAGSLRDACDRNVTQQVKNARTSEQQQDFCDGKLSSCPDPTSDSSACDLLSTPAGKDRCGLSYPLP